MKKFLKYFLTLGVAALTFAACEEETPIPELAANYTISGDASFKDFKATVKVTADKAAPEDVDIELRLDITSTFTADQLTFPASVKVAKGETEVSATVEIKEPNKLEPGDYKAIFGAVVLGHGPVTEKVTITWSKADLNGKWTVIGTVNGTNWDTDFEMAEGSDGWYEAQGIEAIQAAEFKFRKDGKWDLALGLAEKGNAPLDKEFSVTDAPGSPNIGLESGIYTVSVNPNHMVAKVVRTGDITFNYTFSAPEAFDENLKAVLKVACDRPVLEDTEFAIVLDPEKSNFPENTLSVPEKITIAKDAKEGTAELAIVDKTGYGEFTATLAATFSGAVIGTAAVKYSNPVPKMTVADIKALCKGKTSNQQFVGDFSGIYVNYVLSGQHFYLEDETGAIRYWTDSPKIKLGDKISGIVSGLCLTDGNGRPQISWLDTTYGKVEAATEEEKPKPVTGTMKEFADNFDFNWFRRGIMTEVVLENDAKKGINVVSDETGSYNVYLNFTPSQTVPKGSKVSCIGTFDYDKNSGKNYLKVFNQSEVTGVIPPEKKAVIEKLWGVYSGTDNVWTSNVQIISITHPDGYGMARGLAMDDEYIYLPKSSAYPALAAVKIADPTGQVKGNVTGVDAGDTFKSSFVRVMKNTDSSVNGGKDVLIMSNLSAANGGNIVIYAYPNGVDQAPIKMAQFAWDSANSVEDWRRYGDRFFVTGTYQEGKIYLPSFNAGKIVVLSVANGARTAVEQFTATTNSPDGIKDLTVYPGDTKFFLTNNSIANLVGADGSLTNGWNTLTLVGSSDKAKGTWGYNFFEFDGKKYIAYARISGSKAWIEVILDKGDLLTSLEAQEGLLKAPLHSADSLDTEHETGGLADCCVRIIGGVPYIAALTRDGGAVVCKMVLK